MIEIFIVCLPSSVLAFEESPAEAEGVFSPEDEPLLPLEEHADKLLANNTAAKSSKCFFIVAIPLFYLSLIVIRATEPAGMATSVRPSGAAASFASVIR
jgi:hypothetical protein